MAFWPRIKNFIFLRPQTTFSSRDLNPLQRGLLQKCLVLIIYTVSITVFSFFLDWLDKYIYFKIIAHAEEQGKIAENIAQTFINIVVSRGEIFFTLIMLFGIICGLIVFGLIRLTASLQLSCPVELRDAKEESLIIGKRQPFWV